jgi:arylsulfatase A-like enzyme
MDWMPTLLDIAGAADVKDKLLTGYKAGAMTYKVHLDGYDLVPYLTGAEAKSPRKEFFYFSDEGDLTGLRYDNFKFVFLEQRAVGTMQVWAEPFTHLRVPGIYNLRLDPYERASITSNTYYDWLLDHSSCWSRRKPMSRSSSRRSRTIRRARSRRASRRATRSTCCKSLTGIDLRRPRRWSISSAASFALKRMLAPSPSARLRFA